MQQYMPIVRDDEEALTRRIIELAAVYGRYGTPRIEALLRSEGWVVNHKRLERIWRREGLKVPRKQPKRGRLCAATTARNSRRGPCVTGWARWA